MRIRFPPQLIIFALGAVIAMATPGLPSIGPPPIMQGLTFYHSRAVDDLDDRLQARFPPGSPVETMVEELNRQHFDVRQHEDLGSGGRVTYASIGWPHKGGQWMFSLSARSDRNGRIESLRIEEVRLWSGDVTMAWNYHLAKLGAWRAR